MADHDISFGYQPGQEIGYDQITGNVNIGSTSASTPTTIITCASHAFDGGPVMLTVYFPFVFMGSANNTLGVVLVEGGSAIGEMLFTSQVSATEPYVFSHAVRRFTPSAGLHTYLIGAYCNNTTGTPAVGAGVGTGTADVPAFARFTKV